MPSQTSAHAEMDLALYSLFKHPRTNLRSRGDGPSYIIVKNGWPCKPPLTRRWTRQRGWRLPLPRQTSAHAEMDPDRTRDPPPGRANLRSRGDGPVEVVVQARTGAKPPLTRRWTRYCRSRPVQSRQTSAHAEMDPQKECFGRVRHANLRSRGDGPESSACDSAHCTKPPLTRRWT